MLIIFIVNLLPNKINLDFLSSKDQRNDRYIYRNDSNIKRIINKSLFPPIYQDTNIPKCLRRNQWFICNYAVNIILEKFSPIDFIKWDFLFFIENSNYSIICCLLYNRYYTVSSEDSKGIIIIKLYHCKRISRPRLRISIRFIIDFVLIFRTFFHSKYVNSRIRIWERYFSILTELDKDKASRKISSWILSDFNISMLADFTEGRNGKLKLFKLRLTHRVWFNTIRIYIYKNVRDFSNFNLWSDRDFVREEWLYGEMYNCFRINAPKN